MGKLRNIVIVSMLIIWCGLLQVVEAQLLSEIPSKEKITSVISVCSSEAPQGRDASTGERPKQLTNPQSKAWTFSQAEGFIETNKNEILSGSPS